MFLPRSNDHVFCLLRMDGHEGISSPIEHLFSSPQELFLLHLIFFANTLKPSNRPIRGGHEKPSFRLGGGGRLQNAPSANAFL